MKAMIVLLAIAVAFTYGASHANLKYIITELQCLHHETLKTEFDSVFVIDLKKNKTDSCEAEFFCQVEKVLSGVKLLQEAPCHVNVLLMNLRPYHTGVNCSVPTSGDEILLRSFLNNLTKHAKKVFTRPNRMNHVQLCKQLKLKK